VTRGRGTAFAKITRRFPTCRQVHGAHLLTRDEARRIAANIARGCSARLRLMREVLVDAALAECNQGVGAALSAMRRW